jgi:hypothetical protein
MTVDGDVVAVHSRWTSDGSRIVTEATVHTPQGDDVVVRQLGGSVDGLTMMTMPGPVLLTVGMTVAIAAHRGMDLTNHEHIGVDSVKVLAAPPSFVRTGPTKTGKPLYWKSGCVFVTVDAAGTTALAGDTEFALIDESIATWNDATQNCSYLTVVTDDRRAVEVGKDYVNVIKFHDCVGECDPSDWGRPAIGDDDAKLYDSGAAGLTTVVFVDDANSARDGEIVDADVEINGVNFAISNGGVSLRQGLSLSELKNTLTHELGHLQGLEHPCLTQAKEGPRVDNNGDPVPLCDDVRRAPSLPANMRILEATMYNFQDSGETKKETLSQDDINAICEIYPTAQDPGTCEPVAHSSGGCCSASGRNDRSDLTFLLVGATVLTILGRRKRR